MIEGKQGKIHRYIQLFISIGLSDYSTTGLQMKSEHKTATATTRDENLPAEFKNTGEHFGFSTRFQSPDFGPACLVINTGDAVRKPADEILYKNLKILSKCIFNSELKFHALNVCMMTILSIEFQSLNQLVSKPIHIRMRNQIYDYTYLGLVNDIHCISLLIQHLMAGLDMCTDYTETVCDNSGNNLACSGVW